MPCAVQLAHVGPQHLAQFDVDARGGFVQHQHLRLVHQRLAQQQAAAHAARQRAGIGLGLVGQADHGQHLVGAALRFRHAVKPGLHLERCARREERVEVQFLRHHADGGAGLARVHVLVEAPDAHPPGGLDHQPRQDVDQRRLAGAVRAQQAEDRPRGNRQIDALQRLLLSARIGLAQAPYVDCSLCHPASPLVRPAWMAIMRADLGRCGLQDNRTDDTHDHRGPRDGSRDHHPRRL